MLFVANGIWKFNKFLQKSIDVVNSMWHVCKNQQPDITMIQATQYYYFKFSKKYFLFFKIEIDSRHMLSRRDSDKQ